MISALHPLARIILTLVTLLLTPLAAIHAADAPSKKPNIIFVLADDYGVGEVGCYGADNYKTPNIDALAKGGMRYTNAYTAALCGPSRAMILTGRYAFRTGATNQDATGRMKPEQETMMPKVLKSAGYTSTCVGKWGQLPLGPAEFGFDDYLKFKGSGVYWNTQDKGKTYEVNGQATKLNDKEYLPDVMHKHLIDFITKHREQPFYVYYSLSHVHGEILPTPDSALDSKDFYADNIAYMDKLVGKLVAELERLKLREKTLIVFVGDNGTANGKAKRATIGGRAISGAKGSMQEGGGLVPLIVNWPGVTPAGKVSHDMIDSSDFFPTFAELAGAKLPEKNEHRWPQLRRTNSRREGSASRMGVQSTRQNVVCAGNRLEAESGRGTVRHERCPVYREARRRRHEGRRRERRAETSSGRSQATESRGRHPG